ncbi:MAG: Arginine-tRNA ligase [Parcubacteria group bacterium GW2011_GWC1_42_11]|uniref:Arginine--tRNA ligase n=1 Tax=Candidatus Nomurabacteria bacterium GW2011_GWC2_42_20 TaxID=1618756 RepID=A0A0G1CBM4_9BACT|nr:MAG: Arginine-tRNA ligase [Parcubacteria group bacterium GW2011_GWC1_42_11]KKS47048.1 MAG: Arginine-tRNA ligase [Candidatus Nomurabacteria bacterium GW2011_GWC2_42_20]
MSEKLGIVVREALGALGIEASEVVIERPADIAHGDYSTNAALAYAKVAGVSPRELAGKLVEKILETPSEEVKEIEIAGPGFINFRLTDEIIRKENSKEEISLKTSYSGKNILVEHSSPNLFKPFHIGHLMNNIVGEFTARAMQVGGAQVTTVAFPSDISLGIAKAIYVLQKDGGTSQQMFNDTIASGSFEDKTKVVNYLGECYTRGVTLAKENPEFESEIKEIAKNLYNEIESGELHNSVGYELWRKVQLINTEYFDTVLESIGSKLGKVIFESEVAKNGKEIVLENTPNVFTQSEGAYVYVPSEERKDLNTLVFVNSDGHPTYEAKDLGLIEKKFREYGEIDYSLFITDNEQTHHFKVVLDAAGKISEEWKSRADRSIHIPHGRMLFKGQKMSSRLGGVPLALDVIGVVEEEVRERAGEKIAHLSDEEKKKLEREIALSALRIAVLRSKPGMNINFDPESSLSFEGDSGPYLLYTHARCSSLIEKGRKRGYNAKFKDVPVTLLERELAHFEIVLADAVENIAPQKLVTYLFEVAQLFNSFYAENHILGEDKETSEHYLAIVKRLKEVLSQGLWVLGISAPDKM